MNRTRAARRTRSLGRQRTASNSRQLFNDSCSSGMSHSVRGQKIKVVEFTFSYVIRVPGLTLQKLKSDRTGNVCRSTDSPVSSCAGEETESQPLNVHTAETVTQIFLGPSCHRGPTSALLTSRPLPHWPETSLRLLTSFYFALS